MNGSCHLFSIHKVIENDSVYIVYISKVEATPLHPIPQREQKLFEYRQKGGIEMWSKRLGNDLSLIYNTKFVCSLLAHIIASANK